MSSKHKISVWCGESIKDMTSTLGHPVNDVNFAYELVKNISNDQTVITNSFDLINSLEHFGKKFGVEVEFFLNGVSVGNEAEPIYKDLNRGIDLLIELCGVVLEK